MKTNNLDRLHNLALPAGSSLILSTIALLLFPRLTTVACQLFLGFVLIGVFASRQALRYTKQRRAARMSNSLPTKAWTINRGDVFVLIGVAALYIGVSPFLLKNGWPIDAVRSCALFLLVTLLLLKPRLAVWKARLSKRLSVDDKSKEVRPAAKLNPSHPADIPQERIQ